jgi:hypothetical protein
LEPKIEGKVFTGMLNAIEVFLRAIRKDEIERVTLKSLTEHGGQVRPSRTNLSCRPSGMPPLEVVTTECWEDDVLWIEGVRSAFGRVYQISSSFGAIVAIAVCLS